MLARTQKEDQESDPAGLVSAASELVVPSTLSEAVVAEVELGRGPYGSLCSWHGSRLAMKVPHRQADPDGGCPEALEAGPASEAFCCANLAREHTIMFVGGHPNIAQVYQLLNLPNGGIAMLVEAAQCNLLKHCLTLKKGSEPWSAARVEVWKLFKQVLAGLAYTQAKGVALRSQDY